VYATVDGTRVPTLRRLQVPIRKEIWTLPVCLAFAKSVPTFNSSKYVVIIMVWSLVDEIR